jgi:hypothetical protein
MEDVVIGPFYNSSESRAQSRFLQSAPKRVWPIKQATDAPLQASGQTPLNYCKLLIINNPIF